MQIENKQKKRSWMQVICQGRITVFCTVVNVIFICIPLIFTVVEMGWFSKEPTVSTTIMAGQDAPVLRIVADEDFKPRAYINDRGEWAGADVEVALEVANRLGMQPQIVFSDWISSREAINKGEADIILGLEIFSNMQGVLKTIPISNDNLNVYGHTKVTDAASLAGKRVGLMAKSVIMPTFELNCEYVEYYTNTEILLALANKEVDYAICHGSIASNIIKEHKLELEECFTLMESYPAIGVRDDLTELWESLNKVLGEMADDGTIQKLENKWVNASLNHKSFVNVIKHSKWFYLGYLGLMIVIEFMLVIFVLRSRYYERAIKYNETIKEQYNLLCSMADTYLSMHLIHLKENKVSEFSSKDFLRKYVTDDMSADEQMRNIMINVIVSEMQEKVLEFTDLSTVAERMRGNKTISKEFIGKHVGWIRAQFVAVAYDTKGNLLEVVFTTLAIDHEKRREEYLLRISNLDELTGIYNRRAYETDLAEVKEDLRDDFIIVSLDLNGLKGVNDTQGHKAGDLLLKQAAACIDESFGGYGKVYRVGGDEFMALIYIAPGELSQIKEKFRQCVERQRQETGSKVSIACGYALRAENKNASIAELEAIADKNMYQEKTLYYQTMNCQRRTQ